MTHACQLDRPGPAKHRLVVELRRNEALTPVTHLLTLAVPPEVAAQCRPGQFFNLLPLDSTAPLLRRPISICDARAGAGELDLLVQVIGEGTNRLAQRRPGASIDAIGPLGRAFEADPARPSVMIAGGVGVAPLHFLARDLRRRAAAANVAAGPIAFCYGARTAGGFVLLEALETAANRLVLATEDGSRGTRGFVTGPAAEHLVPGAQVFVCGPRPMMQAVLAMLRERGLRGQLSLENQMGCGVGACQGCVVVGARGLIRVCCDGPVVWSDDLNNVYETEEGGRRQ